MRIIPKTSIQDYLRLNANENVTLTCVADAKPEPTLKWECINENGQILSDSGNITFNSISIRNTGNCRCIATNVYGTLRKNISIVVAGKSSNKMMHFLALISLISINNQKCH